MMNMARTRRTIATRKSPRLNTINNIPDISSDTGTNDTSNITEDNNQSQGLSLIFPRHPSNNRDLDTLMNANHPPNELFRSNNTSRHLQISEAIKILPEFNGENITILQFTRECEDLESLLNPQDKYIFVRLVKSKITGKARKHIEAKTDDTLHEILAALKRAYSPHQTLYSLQTELSTYVQTETETASDFGLRIIQNINKSLEIIKTEFESESAKGMSEGTMKNGVQSFIQGLRSDLAKTLLDKQFENIDKAIDEAIKMEQKLRDHNKLHKNNLSLSVLRDKTSSLYTIKNNIRKCFNCGIPGHMAANCSKRSNHSNIIHKSNNFNTINRSQNFKTIKCHQCGINGHIAKNCRQSLFCNNCKIRGHVEEDCRRKSIISQDKNSQNKTNDNDITNLNSRPAH